MTVDEWQDLLEAIPERCSEMHPGDDHRGCLMLPHHRAMAEAVAAWEALRKQAEVVTERGENLITAGAPNERIQQEWQRGGFLVRSLPGDPLALRISIGEAHDKRMGESAYLVFRGNRALIRALLSRALAAFPNDDA